MLIIGFADEMIILNKVYECKGVAGECVITFNSSTQ